MSSPHPLSGLTVVEIGHSVAAPYAGMTLGELGAEVIKVENPKGGDACRGWGPPFTEGTATAFHAFNRAKRGITIDLGDAAEVDNLRALIAAHATAHGRRPRVWFVEDRLETLEHVTTHADLEDVGLFLAAWGYNTPATRATAQASRRVHLLELDRFRRGLGAWL